MSVIWCNKCYNRQYKGWGLGEKESHQQRCGQESLSRVGDPPLKVLKGKDIHYRQREQCVHEGAYLRQYVENDLWHSGILYTVGVGVQGQQLCYANCAMSHSDSWFILHFRTGNDLRNNSVIPYI